jgi:phosphate transport system protein
MTIHLKKEIQRTVDLLLRLEEKVEKTIDNTVQVIKSSDGTLAKEIIEHDRVIDELEVDLEEHCLKALAFHTPVGNELRTIVTVIKINNDLERIADHCSSIAERCLGVDTTFFPDMLEYVQQMIEIALNILKSSIKAFANSDPELAKLAWKQDDQLDKIHRDYFPIIEGKIQTDPDNLSSYIRFLSISRHIERIGDLATNVAEDVIYNITGEIVRHKLHFKSYSK